MKRKEKAESLPKAQLEVWKDKYNKIIKRIIELEKQFKIPFDEKKADELIEYLVLHGPGYLERNEIEYLKANPEMDQKYGMQLLKIDEVFNKKQSITEFETEINKYVEIWKEIIEKAKG